MRSVIIVTAKLVIESDDPLTYDEKNEIVNEMSYGFSFDGTMDSDDTIPAKIVETKIVDSRNLGASPVQ